MHSREPASLAALAGEDRAALSGRPRKANAGQYQGVMQQREPTRNREATMPPVTKRVATTHRAKKKAPRRFRRGALCFLKLSRQIKE